MPLLVVLVAASCTRLSDWFTLTLKHVKVISVKESVVALSSADAADALFATLTQQWKGCNGTTVTSDFPSGPGRGRQLLSDHQRPGGWCTGELPCGS